MSTVGLSVANVLDDALTQELETARQRKRLPPATHRRRIRERAGLTQTALARVLEGAPDAFMSEVARRFTPPDPAEEADEPK